MLLSTVHGKIQSYTNINEFKISTPTWNDKFELPDGLYFVPDIAEYFEYIIKKDEKVIDNLPIRIYVNKSENAFKIKIGYYLELLTPETTTLLRNAEKKITKGKNGENVSHLEIAKGVLVRCHIANNVYEHHSRLLYTFVPEKSLSRLLGNSPEIFMFLKTFTSEFSYIEVWFTDQSFKLLDVKDKISISLVIK